MHVLVPIKDVVPVSLADISQVAADSLGGGETVHVSMDRFCRILESVCRTEFSVKVDQANAWSVLGGSRSGRKQPKTLRRVSKVNLKPPVPLILPGNRPEMDSGGAWENEASDPSTMGMIEVIGDQKESDKGSDGDKLPFLRKILWPFQNPNISRGPAEKDVGGPAAVVGERGPKREGSRGNARKREEELDEEAAEEEESVPLLKLVDELVKNGMYSPISDRDVMMSQVKRKDLKRGSEVTSVLLLLGRRFCRRIILSISHILFSEPRVAR